MKLNVVKTLVLSAIIAGVAACGGDDGGGGAAPNRDLDLLRQEQLRNQQNQQQNLNGVNDYTYPHIQRGPNGKPRIYNLQVQLVSGSLTDKWESDCYGEGVVKKTENQRISTPRDNIILTFDSNSNLSVLLKNVAGEFYNPNLNYIVKSSAEIQILDFNNASNFSLVGAPSSNYITAINNLAVQPDINACIREFQRSRDPRARNPQLVRALCQSNVDQFESFSGNNNTDLNYSPNSGFSQQVTSGLADAGKLEAFFQSGLNVKFETAGRNFRSGGREFPFAQNITKMFIRDVTYQNSIAISQDKKACEVRSLTRLRNVRLYRSQSAQVQTPQVQSI